MPNGSVGAPAVGVKAIAGPKPVIEEPNSVAEQPNRAAEQTVPNPKQEIVVRDPDPAEKTAVSPEESKATPDVAGTPAPLSQESQKVFETKVKPFLKAHCVKCHDAKVTSAGFRIDILGTDFLDGKTADHWKEIIDNINLGKMPPKGQARPNPKEAFVVVEWVNQEMRDATKRAQSSGGRVAVRPMNRTEWAYTVAALFHLDDHFARKIERELPMDGSVDGFDRVGWALLMDKSRLQVYLDVARMVVDEALPAVQPAKNKYRIKALEDHWLLRTLPPKMKLNNVIANNQDFGLAQDHRRLFNATELDREIEIGKRENDFTIRRDNGIEASMSPTAAYTNQLAYSRGETLARMVVKQDGMYRLRIRAAADRGTGKYAVDAVRIKADYCEKNWNRASHTFVIDAPLDQPKVYEQELFLQAGGADFQKNLEFRWNSFQSIKGNANLFPYDKDFFKCLNALNNAGVTYENSIGKVPAEKLAALRSKRDEAAADYRQFILKFQGPLFSVRPDVDLKALPRIWYEYIELEGPFTEWPTKATKEVFFNGDKGGDAAYARQIFSRFLPRAYRRPVKPEEVEVLVRSVQTMQSKFQMNFADAVRASLVTVLTSPDFLYLQEPTGDDSKPHELNDYQLASRLSYLLWSSMPDTQLLDLAAQKKLRGAEVLRGQVKRMAADPRARHFVENFAGQWMKVREFDSVIVDTRFPVYKEYDDALRTSGQREPYEFFHELLRSDLSVLNLLDSDFLVINQRLAKHYGISGVEGEQFRRVSIKPDQRRGGILGMAGLLTYLSDGTRTMPVKRGAYVLDVLWNKPAPLPPPDAATFPVIKDRKLSVRERLVRHRSVESCASCHVNIDPLGLALENYDAIGAWRDRQNGAGYQGDKNDPPIDASGVMPGGKAFKNLAEFKRALMAEKGKFLKGFTEKLLTYALGRPVGAADRELVDQILSESGKQDPHLQALLQAIVANPAFQMK